MPKVTIAIGNVGCGKSTVGRETAKREFDTLIINYDSIREMFYGEYGFKKVYEPIVKDSAVSMAIIALLNNLDVYIDEHNLTSEGRTVIVQTLRAHVPRLRIDYLLFPLGKEGLERRIKEPRNLKPEKWKEIWEELNSIYEPPTPNEGYDYLTYSDGGIVKKKPEEHLTLKNQRAFCERNELPLLMPTNNECPSCRRDFFGAIPYEGEDYHITSCPYCSYSFCN